MISLVLWSALAWGGETRHVILEPGLGLDVEIIATEAGGFRAKIVQGERLMRFNDVLSLEPIERDSMTASTFEVVLVASPALARVARAAWAGIPGLVIHDAADVVAAPALAACAEDPSCLASAFPEPAWRWVVHVYGNESALTFESVLPGRESVVRAVAPVTIPAAIRAAAQQAIELESDGKVPAALVAAYSAWRGVPLAAPTPTHARSVAIGFAPVPGLPSALQHDYAGFGAAFGTAVATSAAWVGLAGTVSTTRGEHIALSVTGAYVFTVLSNQIFLHTRVQRPVTVGLMPVGGRNGVDGAGISLGLSRW